MARCPGAALAGLAIGLLAGLAACSPVIDADQERVCRFVLPAINAEQAQIAIIRITPGEKPVDLRIDYRVTEPERPARVRTLICRFASTGVAANKADLIGVATERGPMSEASFYLLKRFYLETPDATAPPPAYDPNLPQMSFGVAYALQQVLSALPAAAVYALVAAAYALVFGLVGRLVLGFGEFAAVGGAATLLAAAGLLGAGLGSSTAVLLVLAAAVGSGAAALHGVVAGRLVIAPLRQARGQHVLIATIGLGIAMSEYLRLSQGTAPAWLPPLWSNSITLALAGDFAVTTTPMGLLVGGLGIVAGGLLLCLMRFSRFGRAWRAFADEPLAAALVGIDARALLDRSFALACAISGFAGVLMAMRYGTVGFSAGFAIGLKALIAAVIGGIGSIPGAFLGGCIIALGEAFWSAYAPIEGRDIALYVLLAAFLIWRPGGILGYADLHPRRV